MALKNCKECGKEVSTKADKCPHCGAKTKSSIGCLGAIGIVFLIGIIANMFGEKNKTSTDDTTSAPASSYSKPDPKEVASSLLSLKFSWSKKGFDNIMSADFTIQNMSNSDIKDVEITCTHYSNSKTEIDSNKRTIYEIINKHSTKRIKDFDMGFIHSQAKSTSCEISDFTLM